MIGALARTDVIAASTNLWLAVPIGVAPISVSPNRDFAQEWVSSLRVRQPESPDEFEIERLREKRQQENRERDT